MMRVKEIVAKAKRIGLMNLSATEYDFLCGAMPYGDFARLAGEGKGPLEKRRCLKCKKQFETRDDFRLCAICRVYAQKMMDDEVHKIN